MSNQSADWWDPRAAAHLLRRAGFGGTPEESEELYSLGLPGAVDTLLNFSLQPEVAPPATDPASMFLLREAQRARRRQESEAAKALGGLRRAERETLKGLRMWWLNLMCLQPVREKLTLFWHGHFATGVGKVRHGHLMLQQNTLFRSKGGGPFAELLTGVACDPAMLVWLDGRMSTGQAPNENFAREALELFTLGEGHYTEQDVQEAARAFSGWVVRPKTGEAAFVARRHTRGVKTLLGQRGHFGAQEAVEVICAQPRCAEFIVEKIWHFYAGVPAARSLIADLAKDYRAMDLNTQELLRRMFCRREFYHPDLVGNQIMSPVQWMVQTARVSHSSPPPPEQSLSLLSRLGQSLFAPPSVKGWDGGAAWINSSTVILRSNAAETLLSAAHPGEPADQAWQAMVPQSHRSEARDLLERLAAVLLAVPPTQASWQRAENALSLHQAPYNSRAVREAAVALVASPEYNLC